MTKNRRHWVQRMVRDPAADYFVTPPKSGENRYTIRWRRHGGWHNRTVHAGGLPLWMVQAMRVLDFAGAGVDVEGVGRMDTDSVSGFTYKFFRTLGRKTPRSTQELT